ncbi:MAG: DDE-type integrase/transposase/recombinase [Candidatus Parvarchaeota archaeon]
MAIFKPERAERPDERWQVGIMYVKVKGRFFYLIIFIDEYSRYIVHHSLMASMDSNSVSLEAQKAIENLSKDSLSFPVIQSDNGSASISLDF